MGSGCEAACALQVLIVMNRPAYIGRDVKGADMNIQWYLKRFPDRVNQNGRQADAVRETPKTGQMDPHTFETETEARQRKMCHTFEILHHVRGLLKQCIRKSCPILSSRLRVVRDGLPAHLW